MKILQVKYLTASDPQTLEYVVNDCLLKENRWKIEGSINVFDKPNVAENRIWVQTLVRYVDKEELSEEDRKR